MGGWYDIMHDMTALLHAFSLQSLREASPLDVHYLWGLSWVAWLQGKPLFKFLGGQLRGKEKLRI